MIYIKQAVFQAVLILVVKICDWMIIHINKMTLFQSLTKTSLFNQDGNIALSHTDAMKVLLASKTEGESIVDTYIKSVVLPCGTLYQTGLQELQNESKKRFVYKAGSGWQNTLTEHLTWHDVVLWLMLIDLKEKCDYNPMHEELEILQAVYKVCNEKESRKFKTIYGILNLPL